MKSLSLVLLLVLTLAIGCSTSPTPVSLPIAPNQAVGTPNENALETIVSQRVNATLTASAPIILPTVGSSVTPPPPPGSANSANNSPTVALNVSPSVTPIPDFPTDTSPTEVVPTDAPTAAAPLPPTEPPQTPSATPPVVSEAALHGKIMFRSTRGGGTYPNSGGFYIMDADGSNVQQIPTNAATALYTQLKSQEGYSPDKSFLVIGEAACQPNGHCDLYIGDPATVTSRSQGNWPGGGPSWYRADNPVWSPDGSWIAYTWNRDNDRTKNIFKGMPFEKNQDYKRLTDFGGHRDTKDPTYSPDGSQLAFTTQDGPHWQIWVLDATADNPAGANAHNITNSNYDDWQPLWIK